MKIRILFGRERKGPSSEGEGSTPSLPGNLAPKGHLLMMVAVPRQRGIQVRTSGFMIQIEQSLSCFLWIYFLQ